MVSGFGPSGLVLRPTRQGLCAPAVLKNSRLFLLTTTLPQVLNLPEHRRPKRDRCRIDSLQCRNGHCTDMYRLTGETLDDAKVVAARRFDAISNPPNISGCGFILPRIMGLSSSRESLVLRGAVSA